MRILAAFFAVWMAVFPVAEEKNPDEYEPAVSAVYLDGREACQPGMVIEYRQKTYLPFISLSLSAGFDSIERTEEETVSVSDGERTLTASPEWKYLESDGHYIWMGETPAESMGELFLPLESLCLALNIRVERKGTVIRLNSREQSKADGYDEELLLWLSRVIWAEARGECLEGRIAVGQVVLNRMASAYYPDDITEVLFQPYQFSTAASGAIWNESDEGCILAAKLALDGADIVGDDCLFFNSCAGRTRGLTYLTTIGGHNFYAI